MQKHNPRGVQIQPIRTTTVEVISLDWTTQAFRVGAVNAQLVRAACEWVEFHNVLIDNEILGNSRFPVPLIHLLERTVHQVRQERQFDATFLPDGQGFTI